MKLIGNNKSLSETITSDWPEGICIIIDCISVKSLTLILLRMIEKVLPRRQFHISKPVVRFAKRRHSLFVTDNVESIAHGTLI